MKDSAIAEMLALPNRPYWYEESEKRAELNQDIEADIVIVGAGFTGLWSAYYLLKSDPKLNIVILEREHVGFGASGRNGGWASSIFPLSLGRIAKDSSPEAAIHLQAVMNDSVDEIARVLTLENLDADYAKEGEFAIARTPAQLKRALATLEEAKRLGLPDQWRLLNQDEMRARIGVEDALGGYYTPHCAVIHPGKLVRGLAQLVESMGAKIFEKSGVLRLHSSNGGCRAITEKGSVKASVAVKATESYGCQLEGYERSVIPIYSLVLATEPIAPELRERLHLDHRTAFADMRHLLIYAQMTADGRMVIGGRGAPYYFGSKISSEYDLADQVHQQIRSTINSLFPALEGIKITHRWGGSLGISRDWYPSVGYDQAKGIAWGGHYTGDGVVMSNLSGRILKNLILEQSDPILELPFVNHRSPNWEVEPFRWLGVNLGLAGMALADREEMITKRPALSARILEAVTRAS